ncbi:adenylate/guanylate cyclase domain-containing protein [Terrimonas sp. NA20]|uniref:Adenylate/guanylate cyclase domain-containing protein n=1 Tax=Terrimonas ginsenosidimutans TaxID=2908004 RepID=A0ABS9KUJ4_9BACT|nr:adenylate/guanylate cyclase domain-containing protein [Terrimonas ginsenosidimutans]MCG2615993.1 adenylate/guanylate cyclase domain-containing protein [Terrimonas ginsenosidimutans]
MIRNKLRAFFILFSVLYWILAAFYFITIIYAAFGVSGPKELHYGRLLAYGVVVGFSIGLLFGLFPINRLFHFNKRRSFLSVLLIGTGCYVLFFMAIIFLASLYGNTIEFALRYVFSAEGLTVLFHLSVCSLFYHFILQINKKFGPGVLLEYTFGKYFTPKVEERAFMFLDLKSSTRIAESLEHVAYSRMVQDCYAELTDPLIRYRGQVYQYVGDEVVVSWKISRFFTASSCLDFFYAFREKMESKKEYFLAQYGFFPEFKAGLHSGKVTVAEVGEIKTEIAYHGDVLNTASRIQSLCNSLQKDLLVSETFLQLVSGEERHTAIFVTEVALRGKEAITRVFTVCKSD